MFVGLHIAAHLADRQTNMTCLRCQLPSWYGVKAYVPKLKTIGFFSIDLPPVCCSGGSSMVCEPSIRISPLAPLASSAT